MVTQFTISGRVTHFVVLLKQKRGYIVLEPNVFEICIYTVPHNNTHLIDIIYVI